MGTSREFELAVHNFASAINPSATVIFDHKVYDRDTGTPRQVDVWIETKIGGHWPISILASCKLQKRKVNISQVGTFCDEVRSTGAGYGVIYSSSGFTKSALAKAKANGLACCRLYRGEPADLPAALYFRSYLSKTMVQLSLPSAITIDGVRTWNDLFDLPVTMGEGQTTMLDAPGPGWAEVPAADAPIPRGTILTIPNRPQLQSVLRAALGAQLLPQ